MIHDEYYIRRDEFHTYGWAKVQLQKFRCCHGNFSHSLEHYDDFGFAICPEGYVPCSADEFWQEWLRTTEALKHRTKMAHNGQLPETPFQP